MTTPRWLLLAIAGCAAVFVIAVGNPEEAPAAYQHSRLLEQNSQVADNRASILATRLQTLGLIDSARLLLAHTPAAPIRVVYSKGIPAKVRSIAERVTARGTAEATGPSIIGVDVAWVLDTTYAIRGYRLNNYSIRPIYVLPRAAAERCLVVLHVPAAALNSQGQRNILYRLDRQSAIDQLLGPCKYFRAFGIPGAQIRTWLDSGGWAMTTDGSWSIPSPRWSGVFNWISYNYNIGDMTPDGARCVGGDTESCEHALQVKPSRNLLWQGHIMPKTVGVLGSDQTYRGTPLGYQATEIMASMVRQLGRDRFAKVWTSSAPLPEAFQQASGEPLGTWVSRWASTQYGEYAKATTIPGYTLVISGLIVLLTVFIGVRVAAGRSFI